MVVDIPQSELGTVRVLDNPIKLSRTPAVIDRPPPDLGDHTDEILGRQSLDLARRGRCLVAGRANQI